MRPVISGILILALVGRAGAAGRQAVATVYDAVQFVDGATPQSAQAVIPTGKFGHVTMVSQLTEVTNPALSGIAVKCTFTMADTIDPTTTLSVLGFTGTIGREGFVYDGTGPSAILGPYLLCRTSPIAGNVASKLTLKAVFTK